jgi:hypothetical protein
MILKNQNVGEAMDAGGWLRTLGLAQYETTFRESEIDVDILPELTDQDLEKLGIPLGHRKRLLKAIANLGVTQETCASVPASARPNTEVADVVRSTRHFGRISRPRARPKLHLPQDSVLRRGALDQFDAS